MTDTIRRFDTVRARSLALAEPLTPEDCQVQSMPDASPVKWHLAHTTWFFETFVLERFEPGFRPFDAAFRVLFNSYYEGVGERHPRAQRGLITTPTLAGVKAYRANVDGRMRALLDRTAEARELVELGLQHEQQHQELILTDVLHALSFDPQHAPYDAPAPAPAADTPLHWRRLDGGLVACGHDPALDGTFHFDNEAPRHRVWLEPCEIASRPVTNAEVTAFIDDGGYRTPSLWLSLGWEWVRSGSREAPFYWRRDGHTWTQHGLHGRRPVDPAATALHLSFFEADAIARWAGARLPTEAEWEHAARQGALGRVGDAWEWTGSAYLPYPGFRAAPGAVGEYNGKFMCQQFVLRGASCATPAGHARTSYRNFFPPEAQWQFSGARFARDVRT